jgi:hypothetical protein
MHMILYTYYYIDVTPVTVKKGDVLPKSLEAGILKAGWKLHCSLDNALACTPQRIGREHFRRNGTVIGGDHTTVLHVPT